ncbi:cystathionine gamma-synthase [Kalaharituber pfeilii]|nr:cystathionine gamma-synthase [Kalaharituber pfeilii]
METQSRTMESLGRPIPEDSSHAVSVSLPTWRANVGYEEGEEWVMSRMMTGYPRFFVHKSIQKLAEVILGKYGQPDEEALLVPTMKVAQRCQDFIRSNSGGNAIRIVEFVRQLPKGISKDATNEIWSDLYAVLYPKEHLKIAKAYWQHTGEGVSSRRAEFCQRQLEDGLLVPKHLQGELQNGGERVSKGPRRYQRGSVDETARRSPAKSSCASEGDEYGQFVEERFGRNLAAGFVQSAKLAIRKRISGTLKANMCLEDALKLADERSERGVEGFTADDVYLYPCGMAAIFNTHRMLLSVLGPKKSVSYGFPYVDSLKILEKWGPGCYFYGHGSKEELETLQSILESGERIQALFCEFPSNPLLKAPNLQAIRVLADKYDFAVVVDETIGNFINVNVLPHVDVVVSSLTKVFSGASNVMGGCLILNSERRYYHRFKEFLKEDYEDNFWAEDSIFLERNSRDFIPRVEKMNINAETVCDLLLGHPKVKAVHYPKFSPTKDCYDAYKRPKGGYGALFSATFHSVEDAMKFFDTLETAKGPSLGTNFTLSSPYTLLAHYTELDWAAQYGVDTALVRVSVGLEDTAQLVNVFKEALKAIE